MSEKNTKIIKNPYLNLTPISPIHSRQSLPKTTQHIQHHPTSLHTSSPNPAFSWTNPTCRRLDLLYIFQLLLNEAALATIGRMTPRHHPTILMISHQGTNGGSTLGPSISGCSKYTRTLWMNQISQKINMSCIFMCCRNANLSHSYAFFTFTCMWPELRQPFGSLVLRWFLQILSTGDSECDVIMS